MISQRNSNYGVINKEIILNSIGGGKMMIQSQPFDSPLVMYARVSIDYLLSGYFVN